MSEAFYRTAYEETVKTIGEGFVTVIIRYINDILSFGGIIRPYACVYVRVDGCTMYIAGEPVMGRFL